MTYNYYEKQYNRKSFYKVLKENDVPMILCNNIVELEIYPVSEPNHDKDTINDWISQYDDLYDILNEYDVITIDDLSDDDYDDINDKYYYDIQNDLGIYDDVYQYYIINDNDVDLFEKLEYPIYRCEQLDLYIVGITHFGTSWDYILTNFPIEIEN